MKRTSKQLWKTCLHEAGHIIVARKLNKWNTSARARVDFTTGAGAAVFPFGITPSASAVAVASGPRSGKLSRIFPTPRRKKRALPPAHTAPGIRARASIEAQAVAARSLYRQAVDSGTDAQDIARYCISFDPTDPKDWLFRYRRIHAEARLLTWRHRDEIKKAAIQLFHEGEITIAGDPEHDSYFTHAGKRPA